MHRDEQRQRWTEGLIRELGGTIVAALGDDDVVEILLNPDGRIWLDSRSQGMYDCGDGLSPQEGEAILASIAGMLGTQIDAEHPIIEAELPLDGSRIEGLVPPLVASPSFAIRKRATRVFPLSHYIKTGSMSPVQADVLRAAIAERRNIVVSGGTGSGKTTLVNAILGEMVRLGEPCERFVLLEDTVELQCSAENHTALRTSRHVDVATLVKATMRLNPDRIIIGEVRGREALDLLKARNTGHPGGCTTVHANNAAAALSRLDQLAQEADVPSQRSLIADTVGLVIHRGPQPWASCLRARPRRWPRRRRELSTLSPPSLTPAALATTGGAPMAGEPLPHRAAVRPEPNPAPRPPAA